MLNVLYVLDAFGLTSVEDVGDKIENLTYTNPHDLDCINCSYCRSERGFGFVEREKQQAED
jgi:hypothetical protein